MKKGFTLIELLAIIIILAIIALITTPLMLNIIEKAKEGAAIDSAYGYIDEIEKQIAINEIKGEHLILDGKYSDLLDLKNTYQVKVKGTAPDTGEVTITKGKVQLATLHFGKYEVICEDGICRIGQKESSEETQQEVLEPAEVEIQDENGNVVATWDDLKKYHLNIQRDYGPKEYMVDNGKDGNSMNYVLNTYYSEYQNLKAIIKPGAKHIGIYAFAECDKLISVEMPEGLTSIGNSAFYYCTGLTSITIPNSLTNLGRSAFYNCYNLTYNEYDGMCYIGNSENPYIIFVGVRSTSITTININENTKFIYDYALYNCTNLTSVVIPSGVKSIGVHAFSNCKSLTSLELPNGVTTIHDSAFYTCKNLKSIIIPNTVTSIGTSLFDGCDNLTYNEYDNAYYLGSSENPYIILMKAKSTDITTVNINQNAKFICDNAFSNCKSLTSVTFESNDKLLSMGRYAFYYCINLTSISLPKSLTIICDNAFSNCSQITSIEIPSSVKRIDSGVFRSCSKLTSINVDSKNKYYTSIDGVLFNKNKTTLIAFPIAKSSTSYTIPSGVTSISSVAFYGCSKLTSVTIPEGVTIIDNQTFNSCTGLKSITLPKSLTKIDYYAFGDCTSLTSITIPANVTSIGSGAFQKCTNLTSVIFEKDSKLESISGLAFGYCSKLESIEIPASVKMIYSSVFSYATNLTSVTFENTTGWYIADGSSSTSGTDINVTNPETNATNLTSTYKSKYWKRN